MSAGSNQRSKDLRVREELEAVQGNLPVDAQHVIAALAEKLYTHPAPGPAATAQIIGAQDELGGRLLRLANRVSHGRGIPATSLEAATVRIGNDRAKSLAVASAAFELISENTTSSFAVDAFCRASIGRAALARAIAMNFDRRLAGRAFLVGMLQHLGIPLLARRYGRDYQALIQRHQGCMQRLAMLEWKSFGFNHIHVIDGLLQRWGIPSEVTAAVARQHAIPPLLPCTDVVLRLWQISYFVSAIPAGHERRRASHDEFLRRMLAMTFGKVGRLVPELFAQAAAECEDVAGMFADWLKDTESPEKSLQPAARLFDVNLPSPQPAVTQRVRFGGRLIGEPMPSVRQESRLQHEDAPIAASLH